MDYRCLVDQSVNFLQMHLLKHEILSALQCPYTNHVFLLLPMDIPRPMPVQLPQIEKDVEGQLVVLKYHQKIQVLLKIYQQKNKFQ